MPRPAVSGKTKGSFCALNARDDTERRENLCGDAGALLKRHRGRVGGIGRVYDFWL